ncbi:MAG TPA: hypothetical protein PLV51_06385 [Lentimicrobium sp.]|jgi:hypothetical protein|nr:hypothetical protein [Lentimicrobium sp.]
MKSLKLIVLTIFVAISAVTSAQKVFTPKDAIGGKSIAQLAKEWDLKAFQDTKVLYKPGMSQEEFIKAVISNFPSGVKSSFKELFNPYLVYIYGFHAKGLSDSQVLNSISGVETAGLISEFSAYNKNNPGYMDNLVFLPWKKILEIIMTIIETILPLIE